MGKFFSTVRLKSCQVSVSNASPQVIPPRDGMRSSVVTPGTGRTNNPQGTLIEMSLRLQHHGNHGRQLQVEYLSLV